MMLVELVYSLLSPSLHFTLLLLLLFSSGLFFLCSVTFIFLCLSSYFMGKKDRKDVKSSSSSSSSFSRSSSKSSSSSSHKLFDAQLHPFGLRLKSIPGDGNCLFRSISDQLSGSDVDHSLYRAVACQEIEEHLDVYAPFIGTEEQAKRYLQSMKQSGTWGSQLELVALANKYSMNILVHQYSSPRLVLTCQNYQLWRNQRIKANLHQSESIEAELEESSYRCIHLAFHDEEHYSSVRALEDEDNGQAPMKIRLADKIKQIQQNKAITKSHSDVPSLAEKIVMESSGMKNLSVVRQLLLDLDGDVDAAVEIFIGEREEKRIQQEKQMKEKKTEGNSLREEKQKEIEANMEQINQAKENQEEKNHQEIKEETKEIHKEDERKEEKINKFAKPPSNKERRLAAKAEKEMEKKKARDQRKKEKLSNGKEEKKEEQMVKAVTEKLKSVMV
jgi:OTU domain-containing protein 3